ncbi:MAG: hypothetical protein U0838_05240 [Chloroflexota bacterium]
MPAPASTPSSLRSRLERLDLRWLALACALLAVGAVLYSAWDSVDLAVYVEAGRRFGAGLSPTASSCRRSGRCSATRQCSRRGWRRCRGCHSRPWRWGWRLVEVALLALSVRGLGWLGVAIVVNPLVVLDLSVANVGTLFTAAMIMVVRWPSVRTVTVYALLVLLIPKPTLLPVLAWGLWRVRAAWLPVGAVAAAGVALIALVPDFGHAILTGDRIFGMLQNLAFVPAWLVAALMAMSVVLTVLSVRWPRLLGPASVLVAVLLLVQPGAAAGLARAAGEPCYREHA